MPKNVKKHHFLDYSILVPYLILCLIGLIMVYSSTAYLNVSSGTSSMSSVINQSAFWVLSLIVIAVMYKMKVDVFKSQQFIMLATAVIALLLVVVFFATPRNGARGWIEIGSFTLQPAEFFKILTIWYLAYILDRRQKSIQKDFWGTVKRPIYLVFGMTALVAVQPDFGNAAIIVLLTIIMLLASGINYLYTIFIGGGLVGGSVLAIQIILHLEKFVPKRLQYVYNRFAIFTDPFADELNTGHQMVNGYYAMFNGGLFGLGLGNSIQKKGFLKEAQTDYIFAIVMEELGLIVALLILLLLIFMVIRIFLVGVRSKDSFNSLMCIGIGAMFLIQVFINLGGISGIIPLTGITFPFLSLGGSSLLILSICIGFVLNISADEKRRKYMSEQS